MLHVQGCMMAALAGTLHGVQPYLQFNSVSVRTDAWPDESPRVRALGICERLTAIQTGVQRGHDSRGVRHSSIGRPGSIGCCKTGRGREKRRIHTARLSNNDLRDNTIRQHSRGEAWRKCDEQFALKHIAVRAAAPRRMSQLRRWPRFGAETGWFFS